MPANVYADAMGQAYDRLVGLGYERGERDFANHGPMGAEALCTLGFGGEVAAWVEDYKRRIAHHDLPQRGFGLDAADEPSWRAALGRFEKVGDWEEMFARELAEQPWRDVVTTWWPRLLPGLLAGLTHGLIRTAHAVRCLSATEYPKDLALQELSRGLAYWAARYRPLPGEVVLTGSATVDEAVAALDRPGADRAGGPRDMLAGLADDASYLRALSAVGPLAAGLRLSDMTTTFAGIYLGHPEVTPVPLIHGVTAPAAMRLVLAVVPGDLHAMSVAAMWHAHVVLLMMFTRGPGAERQSLHDASRAELPSWGDLFGRAVDHGDEHAIKFTEACYRENALQPDPRFAHAARAALQRIPAARGR